MCCVNGLELIGQILHNKKKKPTNIYCCPKCNIAYFKESTEDVYRRLTPRYFLR